MAENKKQERQKASKPGQARQDCKNQTPSFAPGEGLSTGVVTMSRCYSSSSKDKGGGDKR
ncbi:hypothetical protein N7468_010197 [Penicillium chermesinum]|uniref:Uncharacterized protein n=1 Tax=Penicillium chermesinum TaxID=63820 RepID=A0A9W9TCA7_9EURO|nr:uncharacterized protein N7468_010197 [Penicillium chermesinum]KAJ5217189.1 hypothetical protein N7468_010197 [Penicillium chermesinum]KAJ6171195.1 hypothetical protein N7470_000262 [Penicillium chermesinum]